MPGDVVVVGNEGRLSISQQAYDQRVAGVVSGAGNERPGIILGRRAAEAMRVPVALVGKVFVNVDASIAPIRTGQLLTTSQTPGHAMAALDPTRAFGAIIGKALAGLESGRGSIPLLVSLQ